MTKTWNTQTLNEKKKKKESQSKREEGTDNVGEAPMRNPN